MHLQCVQLDDLQRQITVVVLYLRSPGAKKQELKCSPLVNVSLSMINNFKAGLNYSHLTNVHCLHIWDYGFYHLHFYYLCR